MAGLAGVISLTGALDPTGAGALVETMAQAQKHRSPSGWRIVRHRQMAYVAPELPAQRAGHEPDEAADPLLLAFDGVVTNRDSVRKALEGAGVACGEGDDAVVRAAWKAWGASSLTRIDGRFGLGLYDTRNRTSFLVRDPFGHKPVHYAVHGDLLFFSAELKTLLPVLPPPELDELALVEWALYGEVLAPRTLFRGIRSLGPGQVLEVGTEGRVGEPRTYFDPIDVVDPALFADYAARSTDEIMGLVESAVDRAVDRHMDGRSDVAVMLSGGVDSTVIAALARDHGPLRAYTFSMRGSDLLDELPMANIVAEKLGLPIDAVPVDGDIYRRELAGATYHYEMPLWHMQGVPLHLLARRARQDGIGLFLSGVSVGPFLGAASDRYNWILPQSAMEWVPEPVFRVARKAVYAAGGLHVANPFFVKTVGTGLQLIDGGARSALIGRHADAYRFVEDERERRVQVMRMTDNALFLRRFFHQGDRLCMGASVEYCDAAVDRDYESLAFNLSGRVLFNKGRWKWILKQLSTRYVPHEVAFQKKIPLDVPIEEYFSPQFTRPLFEDGFLASFLGLGWDTAQSMVASDRESADVLLRLVNMETWGRLFFMGQSIEEVTSLLTNGASEGAPPPS